MTLTTTAALRILADALDSVDTADGQEAPESIQLTVSRMADSHMVVRFEQIATVGETENEAAEPRFLDLAKLETLTEPAIRTALEITANHMAAELGWTR